MKKDIDMNSDVFLEELRKTQKFTNKVRERFSFNASENEELNLSIEEGLTRNKLLYGKRFCPCFIIIGKTKEEQKTKENRVCPCKPALEKEIPEEGQCHCGIYCSKNKKESK